MTSVNLANNDLCGCDYNGDGKYDATAIRSIAAALSHGSTAITDLNLEHNHMGAEGAKALTDALTSDTMTLSKLSLRLGGNRLTDASQQAMRDALGVPLDAVEGRSGFRLYL